jgi:hypothetical protein
MENKQADGGGGGGAAIAWPYWLEIVEIRGITMVFMLLDISGNSDLQSKHVISSQWSLY